jgi:hypothetical protein
MTIQQTRVGDARTCTPAQSQRARDVLKKSIAGAVAIAITTTQIACAPSPDSVSARYVSPTMYKDWNCDQLFEERMRLTKEVDRVSGLQRENAGADAAMMAVGIIVFWPALFGLAATKDRKDELGRLKGEYDAVDHSMKTRQCTAPPPAITPGSPVAPATPDSPAVPVDTTVALLNGTYKGSGKTDAWCQTPSMTLVVKDGTAEGQLSEIASGTPTSTITGTVNAAGQATFEFKASKADYINGPVDALFRNGLLQVDLRSKTSQACTYHFELKKS